MINLKIIYDKYLFKYILIFVSIFSILITFTIYLKYINMELDKEFESEENRMINLVFNDDVNINDLIDNYRKDILKNECNNQSCTILFKTTYSALKFKNENYSNYSNIAVNAISDTENNYIVRTIIIFVITISYIIFSILLFLFSRGVIANLKRDISLYKLIGYSNKKIYKIFFGYLLAYYTFIFIISFIISLIVIFKIFKLHIVFHITYIAWCVLLIFFCVVISFIKLFIDVKHISPIGLIHECS